MLSQSWVCCRTDQINRCLRASGLVVGHVPKNVAGLRAGSLVARRVDRSECVIAALGDRPLAEIIGRCLLGDIAPEDLARRLRVAADAAIHLENE